MKFIRELLGLASVNRDQASADEQPLMPTAPTNRPEAAGLAPSGRVSAGNPRQRRLVRIGSAPEQEFAHRGLVVVIRAGDPGERVGIAAAQRTRRQAIAVAARYMLS